MKTGIVFPRPGVAANAVREAVLRVGIFFDGTGNNRTNSRIGNDCETLFFRKGSSHIKACGGRCADPVSSYHNDLTNIARLVELYRLQRRVENTGDGLQAFRSIYVSGVGTRSGGRDCILSGMGLGRGSTGVLAKVGRAIDKLEGVLRDFSDDNPDCFVGTLELDLFGFSRGAAAARHFANQVLLGSQGELGPVLERRRLSLAPGFSARHGDLRIKVIGLFDTVAAVGSLHDLGNVRDARNHDLHLYLPPGCAQQVLHLVAADEQRRNFSLSSIQPGWSQEILVPGTHSDVGGGYRPYMREELLLSRPRHSFVSLATSVEQSPAWRAAATELAGLDPRQWLDPSDPRGLLAVRWASQMSRSMPTLRRVSAAVGMERIVLGHLSRVYLRVMHALACDEGVPFEPVPAGRAFALTEELEPIASKLVTYARGGASGLSDDELALLMRRYIHCSAHWNGLWGRSLAKGGAIYVHAPGLSTRCSHPNVPNVRRMRLHAPSTLWS